MQTSRFQLGLIATLAVGLGFSLASSEAVGYPAGAAVSLGANPVVSFAGGLTPGSGATVTEVSADSELVITDLLLGMTSTSASCYGSFEVLLEDDTGATWGQFSLNHAHVNTNHNPTTVSQFSSGISIPAGSTLTLSTSVMFTNCSASDYKVVYTLAGYHAHP